LLPRVWRIVAAVAHPVPEHLRDHPDRLWWNAGYGDAPSPVFEPHPLIDAAIAGLPEGPVLELACGRSGSSLPMAAMGRDVLAVDISDLALITGEAARRRLAPRITTVLADVPSYDPGRGRFALVLATYYWDEAAFRAGCAAVAPGGLIGWEALARRLDADAAIARPWAISLGELGARLPPDIEALDERTIDAGGRLSPRLLARRHGKVAA
jgi:SAM-dependent methyltransferase